MYVTLRMIPRQTKNKNVCLKALDLDYRDVIQTHKTFHDNFITNLLVSVTTQRIKKAYFSLSDK